MAEKRKKKSLWRSMVQRNSSSRHSMIEASSERSLDRSLDDMTTETPRTVASGSLDRLCSLNSKPPKSGFFQLKPKTPAFWKPLFQHSSTASTASLVTTLLRNQLVQTDSPTQPSTIDFGVQAVIVQNSTHTRDVLVQTCPAWDDSQRFAGGLTIAHGVGDPNTAKDLGTLYESSGAHSAAVIESTPTDLHTDYTPVNEVFSKSDAANSLSEENFSSVEALHAFEKTKLFLQRSAPPNQESSQYFHNSNLISPTENPALKTNDWRKDCSKLYPDCSTMSDETVNLSLKSTPLDSDYGGKLGRFLNENECKLKLDVGAHSENTNELSTMKDEFDRLSRDLDDISNFSEDYSNKVCSSKFRKIENMAIDPSFDVLREGVQDLGLTGKTYAGFSEMSSKACENTNLFRYDNVCNDNTDLRKESVENIYISPNDSSEISSVGASKNSDEHSYHGLSVHSKYCSHSELDKLKDPYRPAFGESIPPDVDALNTDFTKFDSCENLEELEDEIIRSLCSPVLLDYENCHASCEQSKTHNTDDVVEFREPNSISMEKEYFSDSRKPLTFENLCRRGNSDENEVNQQAPKQGDTEATNRICLTLENIAEESNTDDDSVISFKQCKKYEDNDFPEAERAKVPDSPRKALSFKEVEDFSVARTGENADKYADDDDANFVNPEVSQMSVKETSEIFIDLPPRKARIFLNVLELESLKLSSKESTIPFNLSRDNIEKNVAPNISASSEFSMSSSEMEAEKALPSSASEGEHVTADISNEFEDKYQSSDLKNNLENETTGIVDPCPTNTEPSADASIIVSKSHIILQPVVTVVPECNSYPDPNQSPLPPPPPPPPPSLSSIKKEEAVKTNINIDCRSEKPTLTNSSANKSPMMLELEQRFLHRQKIAEDLEGITKKITMDVQKETEGWMPNESDDAPKTSAVSKYTGQKRIQNQNGFHNGHAELGQTSPRLCSPVNNSTSRLNHHPVINSRINTEYSRKTVITDQPPPAGAVLIDSKVTVEGDNVHTDRYYALPVKEVLKEKTSTTKFIAAPEKYEGIGPTEEGIPVSLRQSVKKENMSDWYKTMYKTLHKIDNEGDTYVIGYTSDPEIRREDKRHSPKHDIKSNQLKKENCLTNGTSSHCHPRTSSEKSTVNIFSVQPRSIEDYVPGHSSIVDRKSIIGSKRHLPDLTYPNQLYEIKDGYESESYITKKDEHLNGMSAEKQKMWYRQVQSGGDVPQFGLGKPAPEKPREPVIGPPPPPQPNYSYQTVQHQKALRPPSLPAEYANDIGNNLNNQHDEMYANHMRHVIHSELQQKGYRITSPTGSKPFRKSPVPERKILARSLFNFTAESPREISLKKDDVLFIYRELDKNWYEGELRGSVGIFPISYVEVVPPEHSSSQNELFEGLAKVMFDFPAHTSVELQAKKDDLVHLVRKVDDNWYEGRIRERKGIIPCSYISILREPSTGLHSPVQQGLLSPGSTKESHSSPISSPSLSSKSVSSGLTQCNQNGYSSRIKKGSHLVEPVLYRALYRYGPQNADELELIEGDTIYIVEMCDDGWYVGTSVRTGELGIVPGNYLEKA